MSEIAFRYRRKSFPNDLSSSSTLDSSSPLKSPSSSSSPRSFYPRRKCRLPNFRSMFGNISVIESDDDFDESIPPNSEYDYPCFSDDEREFDSYRRPSTSTSTYSPTLPPDRKHRLSVSSENEEDAIIGLLDLRRRSFGASETEGRGSSSPIASPVADIESVSLFPVTPERDDRDGVKIEEAEFLEESYLRPLSDARDEFFAKVEVDDDERHVPSILLDDVVTSASSSTANTSPAPRGNLLSFSSIQPSSQDLPSAFSIEKSSEPPLRSGSLSAISLHTNDEDRVKRQITPKETNGPHQSIFRDEAVLSSVEQPISDTPSKESVEQHSVQDSLKMCILLDEISPEKSEQVTIFEDTNTVLIEHEHMPLSSAKLLGLDLESLDHVGNEITVQDSSVSETHKFILIGDESVLVKQNAFSVPLVPSDKVTSDEQSSAGQSLALQTRFTDVMDNITKFGQSSEFSTSRENYVDDTVDVDKSSLDLVDSMSAEADVAQNQILDVDQELPVEAVETFDRASVGFSDQERSDQLKVNSDGDQFDKHLGSLNSNVQDVPIEPSDLFKNEVVPPQSTIQQISDHMRFDSDDVHCNPDNEIILNDTSNSPALRTPSRSVSPLSSLLSISCDSSPLSRLSRDSSPSSLHCLSPLSDMSPIGELSNKISTKRRSIADEGDALGRGKRVKRVENENENEPGSVRVRNHVEDGCSPCNRGSFPDRAQKSRGRSIGRKGKPSTSTNRKGEPSISTSRTRKERSSSPIPILETTDRSEMQELIGMVVEALAMTRASSMDWEGVWRGLVDVHPNLKTKRTKGDWKDVLVSVLDYGARKGFFGTVASSGQDEQNNPLPPRYFYIPEKDPDNERGTLLKGMMPRAAGRRKESLMYKQYYWKPLDKLSRWDDEDEI